MDTIKKKLTVEEINDIISKLTFNDACTDSSGELILYLGVFEQRDSSFSDKPDPNYDDCDNE